MHGPGPITSTNPLGWSPAWRWPVAVVDDVVNLLPRKRNWRFARNRALDLWAATGIRFTVTEGPGAKYYPAQPWYGGNAYQYMRDNTIRLMAFDRDEPSFGFYSLFAANLPGAVAVFTPGVLKGEWLKRYMRQQLAGTICHEVGHTLGLWHRHDGGVMAGGFKPDAHDLSSIKGFYL